MSYKPHQLHKDLTLERITQIGNILAEARNENAFQADERDNGWSLGCRGHAWCMNSIIELSKTTSWITIVNPNLKFIFKIGDVEVSIYRGSSAKPKKNLFTRAQAFPEIKQLSLFIKDPSIPEKIIWAYAIETDLDGNTTNVEFFGMSLEGDIISSVTIDIWGEKPQTIVSIDQNTEEPVEQPEPKVGLKDKIKQDSEIQNE